MYAPSPTGPEQMNLILYTVALIARTPSTREIQIVERENHIKTQGDLSVFSLQTVRKFRYRG